MSQNIFWVLTAKIREGELENLKVLKDEMVESTKANEPGALNYEWFISPDEKYVHIFENYSDSAATIDHLKAFVKNYVKRFLAALEIKNYTVYGEPSEELTKILLQWALYLWSHMAGSRNSFSVFKFVVKYNQRVVSLLL